MRHQEEYEEDWKDEAPLLASLQPVAEPDIPEGYFEGLNAGILAQIRAEDIADKPENQANPREPRKGKLIALRGWPGWAAAASIAIIVGIGGVFLFQQLRPTTLGNGAHTIREETLAQLAHFDTEALLADLETSPLDDEELYAMLSPAASNQLGRQTIGQDDAYEYLQEVDLDAMDLQDLDIDWSTLE